MSLWAHLKEQEDNFYNFIMISLIYSNNKYQSHGLNY